MWARGPNVDGMAVARDEFPELSDLETLMNRLRYAGTCCLAAACATFGLGVADLEATWSKRAITAIDVLRRPVSQLLIDDAPEIVVGSSAELRDLFERWRFELAAARQGARDVPRLYITVLPDDLASFEPLRARKELFLMAVLPQILRVNERILRHRAALLELRERRQIGGTLDVAASRWLAKMGELYGVDAPADNLDEMLRRVDVIPPSLALAQAAAESGWGTSRFAVKGRALFGQWTFSDRVRGMIPSQRGGSSKHRVRSFNRLIESVWGYSVNLNSHRAYGDFRKIRARSRAKNEPPSGYNLAAALTAYSEKGAAYVALIRGIMAANKLGALDSARLDRTPLVGS